nr:CBN-CDH-10 protein [Haemonchus contortus]
MLRQIRLILRLEKADVPRSAAFPKGGKHSLRRPKMKLLVLDLKVGERELESGCCPRPTHPTPVSRQLNRSLSFNLTEGQYNLELRQPMDQFSFLSSLPQLSIPRLKNSDFDKLCLSRESGYLTNSPLEFSSSSETLRQQRSPSLERPHGPLYKKRSTPRKRFHASHGDVWATSNMGLRLHDTQVFETMESFLSRNVYKSKCVTCVFEAAHAGLAVLLDDILAEFDRCREALPIRMAEARTEENIFNDNELQAVQGVYQRYYHRLMPFVHAETPNWHAPYWKLTPAPVRPQTSLVVTAWNVFDPSKNATRVLRVAVEDVDDVPPEFPRGATMLFTVPHSSKTTNMVIGRVSAIKRNRDVFHYYLLPNCTQEFDHFSVDGSTGEVSLTATGESKLPDRVELCFLARGGGNPGKSFVSLYPCFWQLLPGIAMGQGPVLSTDPFLDNRAPFGMVPAL